MSIPSVNIPRITTDRALEDECPGAMGLPTKVSPHSTEPSATPGRPSHVRNLLEVPSRSLLSRRRSITGGRRRSTASMTDRPSSPQCLSPSAESNEPEDSLAGIDRGHGHRRSSSDSTSVQVQNMNVPDRHQKVDDGDYGKYDARLLRDASGDGYPDSRKPAGAGQSGRSSRRPITISGLELAALPTRLKQPNNNNDYCSSGSRSSASSIGRSLSPLSRWFISNRFGQSSTVPDIPILNAVKSIDMDSTQNSEADRAAQGEGSLPKDPSYDNEHNPLGSSEDEYSTSSDDEAKSKGESPSVCNEEYSSTSQPPSIVATSEEERMYTTTFRYALSLTYS